VAGEGWLIPAPVVAELAKTAELQPLTPPPGGADPHYRPLAAGRPVASARPNSATYTIAYGDGGPPTP
jgi:hypothetical protein